MAINAGPLIRRALFSAPRAPPDRFTAQNRKRAMKKRAKDKRFPYGVPYNVTVTLYTKINGAR